ncbi:MAG: 2-amino-4-hydroxy-6-hydroxymethyldihydropteridine diphosphokinase [Patescibacteria group bacterium]
MAIVAIGLGGNLDHPLPRLRRVVADLSRFIDRGRLSRFYETRAFPDPSEPNFVNAVFVGRTVFSPPDVLEKLQDIEVKHGRIKRGRWKSREVDLDLIFYDDLVLTTADLIVPHAFMHERDCVLKPLKEIYPTWRHPVLGLDINQMITALDQETLSIIRVVIE